MADSSNRQKEVFLKAMDLVSPQERAAFLDQACAGDDALRQRMEAMLKVHAAPDSFLEKPAAVLDLTVDASPGTPRANALASDSVGTRIGPYKLLEQIGEGGMGVVYMAQQQEPVRRTVALKIIKPGLDSAQVLARFEAERQALALMDHPNIARVLDAGATADGRPFFVMELVKGTPITKFCDERRLGPRQRLELFVCVCQAIQHAHQKGVIHRDIKPSNVLVALYDDKPVPKVIDFGVAKAAGQALTEKTLHTGFGAILGTPEYMSPEQATFNQLDIDTRSDVYALGVLLYELLTGTTPVDKARLKEAALLEVLRVVREEEPARPSVKLSTAQGRASIAATRGTDPGKLAQLLRGELDWIVMKALEKDRNRRYETAASLARDVDRYLKDELVEARPPSAGYRLRKFVRRNRGTVLAVALVLLALMGGIAGTTWGLFEARNERDDADRARLKEITQRTRAEQNEAKALAARQDAANALTRSEGLRLLLQSELARPNHPTLAMLLAIEGAGRHPGLLANNTLLVALDQNREEKTLPGGGVLCFSPDGRRLLAAQPWTARVCDVHSGKELVRFENNDLSADPAGNHWFQFACFDPDGKRILTTSAYGRVRLWDAATGKALALLEEGAAQWTPEDEENRQSGHEYAAPAQFSPDGRFILTSHGKARLWDAVSGKEQLVLKGHEGPVFWAAFNRDGTKIITASRDTTARIWDAASGKQLHLLKCHATNATVWASFSPDGSRAVTVTAVRSRDGRYIDGPLARLWDAQTGKEIDTLGAPETRFPQVQFSPDGSRILTYDYHMQFDKDPLWHFWEARTGKHLGRTTSQRIYRAAAFSPDGKRVAFFGQDLDWWNAQTLELERTEIVRGTGAVFSPDGQRLATTDASGVHIWAVAGEAQRRLGHWTQFPVLALSPDGRALATRSGDPKEVVVWDLATAQEIVRIKGQGFSQVTLARFSPDSRRIIFGRKGHYQEITACVADVGTGRLLAVLDGGEGGLVGADISPAGLQAVTVHGGGTLRIWNLSSAKELGSLKLDAKDAFSGDVHFSPDGRWILTGQETGHHLRDASGKEVAHLLKPNFTVPHLGEPAVFSPDSRRVLTTHWFSNPPIAHVWDTAGGKVLAVIQDGLVGRPLAPAFSSDGAWIVMACGNHAGIWETATGKQLLALKPHDDLVLSASLSADKTRIVTASADKTVRLWDAGTGELLAVFRGHQEAVASAHFLPEGRVLSVDKNGAARVWPVDPLPTAKALAPRALTPEERKQYEVPAAVGR